MLKDLVKRGIGAASASAMLHKRLRKHFGNHANILFYHYIGEPQPFYQGLYSGATMARFRRDLALFERYFEFVSLTELLNYNANGTPQSQPRAAITFDDGFNVVRSGAMEILNERGIKATTFLVTSCIGNKALMWRNKLCAIRALRGDNTLFQAYGSLAEKTKLATAKNLPQFLRESSHWPVDSKEEWVDELWNACDMPALEEFLQEHQPYFTADDLQVWQNNGHEIGLHTKTHPDCSTLTSEQVDDEVRKPARELKNRFRLPTIPFSYPFGYRLPLQLEQELFTDQTVSCALGIKGAVPLGSSPRVLERTEVEVQPRYMLFGKAAIDLLLRSGKTKV